MSAKEIQFKSGTATALVPTVIVVIVLVALLINATVIVDSGHVGVVRTLGAVQDEALKEGFHLRKPFIDKVVQIDIRLTTSVSLAQAASKDLQIVTTEVTVQYSLVGELAPQTYQRIGTREVVARRLVEPAIQESVKAITAQYTAEQLVTQRSDVKTQIQDAIVVPSLAVIPELGGKKVFVVEDGMAQPRSVESGIRTEDEVQITAGLAPGDRVIVSAIQRLRPGLAVEPAARKDSAAP